MANVLVVGSGGREHALSWKLAQSPKVDKVFVAPGNGGTENNITIHGPDGLAEFAGRNECFTVVGPEAPLAAGIVDRFNRDGLGIFGPTRDAARLESSKVWAKDFMNRHGIPTAGFETFDDARDACEYAKSVDAGMVVKAEGLAAGKGVTVCGNADEAILAIRAALDDRVFGDAGDRIIIEERVDGVEASYIAICDGRTAVPMASSQDHKRAHDGDCGPNTGGMGAYSPTPVIGDDLAGQIQDKIIQRTVDAMRSEGAEFKGFLYAGIMIRDGSPVVLEYNVRMGDPECQPIVARMDFDLYDYMVASAQGRLSAMPTPAWKEQAAVCVVMASAGYPGQYPKGEEITGIGSTPDGTLVFHAGTKNQDGRILSNGGRVLGVTALGGSLQSAVDNAYAACESISWQHAYYRKDIGRTGLSYF